MTEDKNKEQELTENVQEQTPETNIESETAAETAEAEAEEKDPNLRNSNNFGNYRK